MRVYNSPEAFLITSFLSLIFLTSGNNHRIRHQRGRNVDIDDEESVRYSKSGNPISNSRYPWNEDLESSSSRSDRKNHWKDYFRSFSSNRFKGSSRLQSTRAKEEKLTDDIYETMPAEKYSYDQHEQIYYSGRTSHSSSEMIKEISSKIFVPTPQPLKVSKNIASKTNWAMRMYDEAAEQAMNNTKSNTTSSIGGPAFLPCRVGHLGDRQISWIRSRDWRVLTSGKALITYDKRFSILHEPGSQDWVLHILKVDKRDEGSYECQVSTGTGIISMFTYLKVVFPEAHIPGQGQYHVNKGSPITINCFIHNSPSPPQYIFWHHNGRMINFIRNHPEIIISSNLEPFQKSNTNNFESSNISNFFSRLYVEEAEEYHSGNYTCTAYNIHPSSTQVFVTEGDKTAAVQRIDSSGSSAECSILLITIAACTSVR